MADSVANTPSSLSRLSDVDYEVANDQPDVRGWDVVIEGDDVIGEVDDLIIDTAAGKVRYLDVDLDTETLNLEQDRRVLIPIANAQLDVDEKQVVLGGMTRAAVLKLPENDASSVSAGYDDTFRSHVSREREPDTARMTRSAEELRVGKRMEKTGDVRVSKHVETEHVSQTVPVEREEIQVERRPVERAVGGAVDMRNDEISVPVMEEQVVVEKRPVVKEEIIVSKTPVTAQEKVETDVRREELDVKPTSGDINVKNDLKGRGGE